MELSLARQEIVQVASVSSRNTMALLPIGKKKKVGRLNMPNVPMRG
jgi:hypothetical protein